MPVIDVERNAGAVAESVNFGPIWEEIAQIAAKAWEESVPQDIFVGAGETIGVAEAMAEALGNVCMMPVTLSAMPMIALAYLAESVTTTLAGKVPWVGKGLAGIVHGMFRPVDLLKNSMLSAFNALMQDIWGDLFTVGAAVVEVTLPRTSHGKGLNLKADGATLQREVSGLQRQINHLQDEVTNLSRSVHGANTQPVVNLRPLVDVLHGIQNDVNTLYHNQTVLQGELARALGNIPQVQHELDQLRQRTASIHAVEVTITDLINNLERTQRDMSHTMARQGTAIQVNNAQLRRLSPLELLLQPGMRGLRNLRKLEDNPCQCKGVGGLPLSVGDPLALLEFIENG